MTHAVIAFGANLGDREATIASATRALAGTEGVTLVAVSPVYETPAIRGDGVDHDAPGYLNGVLAVDTTLEPHDLLDVLQAIETEHGRVRAEHWGDRTLDLDLIDFGGRVLADDRLVLPHPRAWQRAFVLQPWLDIEPDAVLAGRGSVAALRLAAHDEVVRR
ncbi:2-amino-4-hydroxy-6-hydroxymethyldihydropteridine diphosphokinase [Agromyces sp. NPDC058484]|uniref:2-amino-4-hydroxy-6- hydroxymethyldihydropteridine diphosphokinase n=1 Tax=Agromyces sp. NPDC058484 TaxID=3346524 RepID=UPI00365D22D0